MACCRSTKEGERIGLAEPTRQLIRGLAGLPAIIEQCGWPRKLALRNGSARLLPR